MLLVELLKRYAGTHKSDKSILSYLNTEHAVAKYDPNINIEDITEDWLLHFQIYAGAKEANNVKKAMRHFPKLVLSEKQ